MREIEIEPKKILKTTPIEFNYNKKNNDNVNAIKRKYFLGFKFIIKIKLINNLNIIIINKFFSKKFFNSFFILIVGLFSFFIVITSLYI